MKPTAAQSALTVPHLGEIGADVILDAMGQGVVVTDEDGWIVQANPAACRLFGQDEEQMVGVSATRIEWSLCDESGASLPDARHPINRVLASGEAVRDVVVGIARPDAMLWLSVTSVPAMTDRVGQVSRVVSVLTDVTELFDAQRHLDGILNAAVSHAIIATDLNNTITTFNRGAERMLGYSAEELIGKATSHLFADDAEVAVRLGELGLTTRSQLVDPAHLASGIEGREWMLTRKDGSKVRVELNIHAMRDRSGEPTGFIGICTDVTDAVAAREKIATQADRWRRLLEELPDVSVFEVEIADDGEYRFLSATGHTRANPGPDEIIGRTVLELASVQNRLQIMAGYRAAFAGKEQHAQLRHEDGWWLDGSIIPLGTVDGRPRVMVVVRDVTQDKERQIALAQAEERSRRMFAEAPSGGLVHDLEGRVVRVNRMLCSLIAMTEDELVGRSVLDVVADLGGDVDQIRTEARRAIREGRSSGEHVLHRADGSSVYVVAESVALLGPSGEPEEVLVHVVDVTERRRFEVQLEHLANHDPLTDLLNRRRFEEELAAHMDRSERYGHSGAVMLLDLDNFKRVNDTLGHNAGDDLILAVTAVLRSRLRKTDVVARLGGDEFAILLPTGGRTEAEAVAGALVEALRTEVTVADGTRSRRVTASIGVVLINKPGLTPVELMKQADLAMYDSKEAGRDGYTVVDLTEVSRSKFAAHTAWADRIEGALEDGAFVVYAQPILDLHTGIVRSAELLVRLLGDDGELVSPGAFLYTAERTGLITEIDEWMVTQAADFLARTQQAFPDFRVEVNLSGKSIGQQRMGDHIKQTVLSRAIAPSRLIFEVTETAAVSDIRAARLFADELKQIGCQFALDDFGAGFGSFYYLKHLPFDYLKIDGEFVAKCAYDPTDQLILGAIVEIARGMNKKTIAEFVGDPVTLETIRAAGIDNAQGFHIGRPVPVDELVPMATFAL